MSETFAVRQNSKIFTFSREETFAFNHILKFGGNKLFAVDPFLIWYFGSLTAFTLQKSEKTNKHS